MIKVEVTSQEEILQEEIPWKETAALIDEALAQKIYKAIEDQAKALKKIDALPLNHVVIEARREEDKEIHACKDT